MQPNPSLCTPRRRRQPQRPSSRTTLSIRTMARQDERGRKLKVLPQPVDHWRPQTRADCASFARPCPYVGCRYNTALEVTKEGSLRLTHVDNEGNLGDVVNCALDWAEHGPMTLEDIGHQFKLTRERIRQEEVLTMQRARRARVFPQIEGDGLEDEQQASEAWD